MISPPVTSLLKKKKKSTSDFKDRKVNFKYHYCHYDTPTLALGFQHVPYYLFAYNSLQHLLGDIFTSLNPSDARPYSLQLGWGMKTIALWIRRRTFWEPGHFLRCASIVVYNFSRSLGDTALWVIQMLKSHSAKVR